MSFYSFRRSVVFTILMCSVCSQATQRNDLSKTELQWSVCENSATVFAKKIGIQFGNPEKRKLYYLETNHMALTASHGVLRIREINGRYKTSAKVNFKNDQNLPWEELQNENAKCEWDRYGDFSKVGCSLNYETGDLTDAV